MFNQNLFKIKVYCAYHNSSGWAKLYHHFILILVFTTTILLNLALDYVATPQLASAKLMLLNALTLLDTIVLTLLLVELVLKLYSMDCVHGFEHTWTGLALYLKRVRCQRLADLATILVLSVFVGNQIVAQCRTKHLELFRILHFVQLLQFYRVFIKKFRVFMNVISENRRLIVMTYSVFALMYLVVAYSVFFLEQFHNNKIKTIFDSLWSSMITLTTVGYGDVVLETGLAKMMFVLMMSIAFCIFSLPASICGSALAMRLEEKKQTVLLYYPAAILMQTMWRFKKAKEKVNTTPEYDNDQRTACVHLSQLFLVKMGLILASNRFRHSNLVYKTGSVSMQYVYLQRKVESINNVLWRHKIKMVTIFNQLEGIKKLLVEKQKMKKKGDKVREKKRSAK